MYQYLLLDAARMGAFLEEIKKLNSECESLYKTKGEEDMLQSVAPYLFSFSNSPKLTEYFYEKGWGDSWGIIVGTSCSFTELYKHLRKFLMVKTEDGEELYFRFYDPRVLRIFLPTCDAAQLKELFGPIDYFLMEEEDSEFALKYSLDYKNLRKEQLPFNSINKLSESKSSTYATTTEINNSNTTKTEFDILEQKSNEVKKVSNPEIKKPKWNIFD